MSSGAAELQHHADHSLEGHVLGQIGLHFVGAENSCGPGSGLHLHLSPVLLDPDGHVDFGVLGVFLDMASSQVGPLGPFVHADISVHRIAKPTGTKLFATARSLRRGKRTAIIHVEAFDEFGVRVADSTQQTVLLAIPGGTSAGADVEAVKATRRRFFVSFDGACRLEGRLHDIIGLSAGVADDGSSFWTMPLGPSSVNGHGGLHGGVAFDLVVEAAVGGASRSLGRVVEPKGALLRYLASASVGPFRAVPEVMPQGDGAVFVRVHVYDDGNDSLLCIVGEVHLA